MGITFVEFETYGIGFGWGVLYKVSSSLFTQFLTKWSLFFCTMESFQWPGPYSLTENKNPLLSYMHLHKNARSCEHRLQVFMYIISKCTTVEHTWAWLSACFQRRCRVDVRVRCCVMKFLCDGVNTNRDDFTEIYFPGLTVGCCWTLSFTNRTKATKSSVWASCYDCATYFHISHRCSCSLRVKLDQLDYI